jgi:hypothetical protein
MKRRVIAGLIAAHFYFVLSVASHLHDWLGHHPRFNLLTLATHYYSAVTFTNRNFGFFAPAVTPDWNVRLVLTDRAGRAREQRFAPPNREMAIKMYSMTGHFGGSDTSMDLFARSWAVKALNENPDAVRVDVEVMQNQLPSMAEYRAGRRIGQELLYRTTFELE